MKKYGKNNNYFFPLEEGGNKGVKIICDQINYLESAAFYIAFFLYDLSKEERENVLEYALNIKNLSPTELIKIIDMSEEYIYRKKYYHINVTRMFCVYFNPLTSQEKREVIKLYEKKQCLPIDKLNKIISI